MRFCLQEYLLFPESEWGHGISNSFSGRLCHSCCHYPWCGLIRVHKLRIVNTSLRFNHGVENCAALI